MDKLKVYIDQVKEFIVKPCVEYTKQHKGCVIISTVLFILLIIK
jgi:hypothetical protein